MLFITCLSRHKFANNLRSKSCKLIGIQKIFSLCVYKHMYTHRTSEGKYKQSVVQSLSHVQLFTAPWTATCHVPLSSTISWNLLKFMFIESVMLSNHLLLPLTIPCHPLLLLQSIFPSIRVFSNESALCIRWPKDWSFSISPSNEFSGLISFRTD